MSTFFNLINYSVLAILALAFIGIAAFCLILITKNVQQGKIVRQNLAEKIGSSRISSALGLFNIDHSEYLHTSRVSKIIENIDHCEDCVSPWCSEESNSEPTTQDKTFYFCPIANHFLSSPQS